MSASFLNHLPIVLRPDPSRTVVRPFMPGDPDSFAVASMPRSQRIIDRVMALSFEEGAKEREKITESLDERHRDVDAMLMRRFHEVLDLCGGFCINPAAVRPDQALLIGAYFCNEYSFEAAALFNPSMVIHPDQSEVPEGSVRFLMALRAIGEGHVSSVTFRTGLIGPGGDLSVDVPSRTAVPPIIQREEGDGPLGIKLLCGGSYTLSETVLFPMTPSQRQGIEDLRLVHFVEDDGSERFYGTYTAFSGAAARSELLDTETFRDFDMRPLRGDAAGGKGMALFPRRIAGRYAMLSRHDNENIWFLQSDDLETWNGGTKILCPRYPWEFVQMGNCGSPIEIDEGWLVLTHGVGVVRNYCIGACLLDKRDPSKVLARTPRPLIEPAQDNRNGYVPNVIYSCGGLVRGRTLYLPYGVADDFATIATADVSDVLAAME
ncbi:glycoside hydrolase family 130 protein [Sphingomonas sp. PAMC 26605]|uniref:glycoside hydrolase family 130 protein n=1 Tax=Sphingomonas sp. PAMC 26605 TaxID=1112214 RepID=UPI00026CCAF1|nr:glycoside hydrolase family 130 protein [Sphingomonas sp. PAMC 26605]